MNDETDDTCGGDTEGFSRKERDAILSALAFGHGFSGALFGLTRPEMRALKAKLQQDYSAACTPAVSVFQHTLGAGEEHDAVQNVIADVPPGWTSIFGSRKPGPGSGDAIVADVVQAGRPSWADSMAFPPNLSPPCAPFRVASRRPGQERVLGSAVTPAVADLVRRLAPIPAESQDAPTPQIELGPPPLPPGIVECIERGLRRFEELHPE